MGNDLSWSNPGTRAAPAVALSALYRAASGAGAAGGNSALGWSTGAQSLAHGASVTLTTDGTYAFSAKAQASPVMTVMGSNASANGVASTAELGASIPDTTEIWGAVAEYVTIETSGLRHSNVDQMYKSVGRGNMTTPMAFNGLPASVKKNYLGYWARVFSNFAFTYSCGYSGLTGAFSLNTYRGRGERVTITCTNSSVFTGYICWVNQALGQVTFEVDTTTGGGQTNWNGATVTGDVSGASLTLITTTRYTAIGAAKICRVLEATSGANRNVAVWSHNDGGPSGGLVKISRWDSSNVQHDTQLADMGSPSNDVGNWLFCEMETDLDAGVIRTRVNGGAVHTLSGLDVTTNSSTSALHLDNIGMETGNDQVDGDHFGIEQDWGEIYSDKDFLRVYLADAPNIADATHLELQIPTAWTSAEISIQANQGSFPSFTGLYWIIENGMGNQIASGAV